MKDYDVIKTLEERRRARDLDAAGFGECVVASLPPRRNGPACYLSINEDTPTPMTGCFLVGPCSGYDELVVMADWRLGNTLHTAALDIWQTMDPEYRMRDIVDRDPPGMVPFLAQADPVTSSWRFHPQLESRENSVILRFKNVIATHIGLRLMTQPKQARLFARIWVLMIRNGEDGA
jgi:hypothetical protein